MDVAASAREAAAVEDTSTGGPPVARGAGRSPASALFWRILVLNGLVFVLATAVLVVSPATVSAPVSLGEVGVLVVGLVLILVVNAVVLRASLRPLDGLTALMERVDLLRPGERAVVGRNSDVSIVISTFNAMLDRLESERGASAARALEAQEGERRRIAQELHDEIGQSLTAVLLTLKRVVDRAPEDLRTELRTVQDIARGSLDEVRQVAARLRPGVLDDLGLVAAMDALASEFTGASRIPTVRLLDDPLPPLDRSVELVVYRVAQESLTNVARHAGASRVELALGSDATRVLLRVTDDGRGLDRSSEGAGIRGMRERALLVGADLTVGPGRDGGAEVRLAVPHDRTTMEAE